MFKLLSFASAFVAARDDKCYGLAISAGKGIGPYQAGTLQEMLDRGLHWDAISGVTEGAINAYILSLNADEPKDASDALEEFWHEIGSRHVISHHPGGWMQGVLLEDGMYLNNQLFDLLDEKFGPASPYDQDATNAKTKLNLAVANLANGTFTTFNQNFKGKDLLKAIKASLSYPVTFEPFQAWNSLWVSGDTIQPLDATAPILQCKAMGYAEEDIIIDTILDQADELKTVDATDYNAGTIGGRTFEVRTYYAYRKPFMTTQRAFPKVNYRYVLGPKSDSGVFDLNFIAYDNVKHFLPIWWKFGGKGDGWMNWCPIDHTVHNVKHLMKQGRKDAEAILDEGRPATFNFETISE